MPTYVTFLRAINLGARRRFPKAAVIAATESVGATDVRTYLNTGNVRLTTRLRSRGGVERALERAYADDRGFEVPVYAFTPAEVVAIADDTTHLWSEHGEPGTHYVSLFREPPADAAARAVQALAVEGETVVVTGRAAHVLLHKGFHESRLLNSREFQALGEGTARTARVLRHLADAWC